MTVSRLSLSSTSVLALVLGAAALPTTAFAQTAPATPDCANPQTEADRQACANAAEQADPNATSGEADTLPTQTASSAEPSSANEGDIVVTGSRLRRDERTSADPVTVIDPNLSAREGRFDTAEILQTSPIASGSTQITSTISSNFVVNGGEGVQTISLRGLGANRTLVLLNGRRAGPAGVRGGVSAFDLNVIPSEAIQTIDILKTGASSIYGSDAIAGVVNLITKKDLRGLQVRAFTSIPGKSGGEQYSLSGTYGFALGDRGHVTIGADYYRVAELERGDRDYLGCEEENVRNVDGDRVDPIDPRSGEFYCGNFPSDVIQITDYIGVLAPGPTNLRGPLVPRLGGGFTRRAIGSVQFNRPGDRLDEYLSGILAPPANEFQFGAPAGFFPVGSFNATGLALANNFDDRVLGDSVIPKTDRYTLFAEAGYEITDNINLYFEGLANRRKTKTDGSRQIFFSQFTGNAPTVFTDAYSVYLPYFFCDPQIPQCDPFATGDPLNTEFTGSQLLTPIVYAPSDSSTDVKYLRGVIGARANIDNLLPKGFVDVYFQHSRSDGDYKRDIIYRDAIEFGVAELRTNLCAGTVTAIRGVPCIDIDYTDPRILAGNFTAEERDFLFGVDEGNTLYKQNTAEITFGGDLARLPAGAVKFALGAQFRRDEINDTPGENSLAGNLWASTTSGVTAGFQRSTEFFGEVEVPVLRDLPGIQEFTLNGAARLTNTYSRRSDGQDDSDKGNWTYKLGANFAPTNWLRFRATLGTSFRSPALFEQFLNRETGFLGEGLDPCIGLTDALEEGTVSQRVYDNCVAAGADPDNFFGDGSSFESVSIGNVGALDPETSKALTAGFVLTPQTWLWSGGRFSLAVDYIDIKVKNQVTQLGAGTVLAACYGSINFPDEPFCDLIRRQPTGSAFEFALIDVEDPYLNIDQQHNSAFDFTVRFRQDMGRWGTLSLLGQATVQTRDKFTLFQGFPSNSNGETGDPKWTADLNASWVKDSLTLTYGLDFIGKTSNLQDFKDAFGSQVTENNCLLTPGGVALRGGEYCPVYKLPRVFYHSLSAEYRVGDRFSLLGGVANIFDKKPPAISTVGTAISGFGQTPLLGSYYDYIGRRFFLTARARFGG